MYDILITFIIQDDQNEERLIKVREVISIDNVNYAVVKDDDDSISFCRVLTLPDGSERLTDELSDEEYEKVKTTYKISKLT